MICELAKDLKYLAETLFLFMYITIKHRYPDQNMIFVLKNVKFVAFQGVLLLLYDQLNQPFFVDALDGVVGVVASVVS